MAQENRLCRLKNLLDTGRSHSKAQLLDHLGGISFSTLKRDLDVLRHQLHWPIEFDRDTQGWRLDLSKPRTGIRHELPGLRFDVEELCALLTLRPLLDKLDAGGLIGRHIEPMMQKIDRLIEATDRSVDRELARRIKVQPLAARPLHLPHLQTLGTALLRRQRLVIRYHARTTDQSVEREISPQRLVHYRDNWYLDAWCHLRESLRSFSLDAIREARIGPDPALDIPDTQLDATLGTGYGIVSGPELEWATLRFTPDRARWIAAETWHPQQRSHFDPDGHYILQVPYADPRELVRDVMRHVPDVEVVGPVALRNAVRERLEAGLEKILGGLSG